MIILRKGTKDKFWYENLDGAKVEDKEILNYVANLKIPPMYHDVEIFYIKDPKILFQGHDDAGRLQQIYSPEHCKAACRKKFQSLINFGNALPKIYADCDKYMQMSGITKQKIIAVIIKIISWCYFRIGNIKYVKLYDHYGVSTMKKEHIRVASDGMHIKFVGKKGVVNECHIEDSKMISAIKSLMAGKASKDFIFTYNNDGETELIKAIEINKWLGQYGENFTTKMFRNFDANIILLEFLKTEHSSRDNMPDEIKEVKRKKILVSALKIVASEINNTPAICKKAYISPELIELYLNNPGKFNQLLKGPTKTAFINFLKTIDKNDNGVKIKKEQKPKSVP